ncbi:stage III sporulation protein AA [Alkaliphilus sp. B6464]|uniref:stage III sporulation protein AA n=1 Tax=Alkaliphilus sp. B6464 TaxID=2731219 RepID=UPI002010F32A|nr:stage III sporulation protein AA [Alkaliphilus sp. B6464]
MEKRMNLINQSKGEASVVSNLEFYLCPDVRKIIKKIPDDFKLILEEIRLRVNKPLMVFGGQKDYFVDLNGNLTLTPNNSYYINRENIEKTLQFASDYSIYSVEDELKNGYITIQGGHRIGIVGKVLMDSKGIRTLKNFSGLNIRISREKLGVAATVLPHIITSNGEFLNTLIVSPPQCGKTTLLRDIIRMISQGVPHMNFRGIKVGVVDERSEIGACFQGVPQNDLGPRTDILDSCPKAEGMMMLIRAMSPQVIATDEIGREEDSISIEEAMMAGIKLITTVHGRSLENILNKKIVGKLVKDGVFERIVFLSNSNGVGTVDSIVDGFNLTYLYQNTKQNRLCI